MDALVRSSSAPADGASAPVPRTGSIPRRLLRLRSDLALAERFAAGDEYAFALLYERHRKSVLAVCMGVLGSRPDAEDAAQEAFAALALSLRKGPPENLTAWLTKVARNAAIDVARRRRIDTRAQEGVPDRSVGGEGAKAEIESVMAGIRELPEAQRTALLMRELAGHSYREIAALLEVDEAAVHGLIARARIGLRAYREAYDMSCAAARAALVAQPDGRRHDRTVRRHVRMCASCRAYKRALRGDARALRGLAPDATIPVASGGALFSGLAAKGALIGGTVAQVTAACAVSVCAIGGVVLVAPHARERSVSSASASRASKAAAGRPAGAHRGSSAYSATGRAVPGTLESVSPRIEGTRAGFGAGNRPDGRGGARLRWERGHSAWLGSAGRAGAWSGGLVSVAKPVTPVNATLASVGGPARVASRPTWGSTGGAWRGSPPAGGESAGQARGGRNQQGDRSSGFDGQANESPNPQARQSDSGPWVRDENGQSTGSPSAVDPSGQSDGSAGAVRHGRSGAGAWSPTGSIASLHPGGGGFDRATPAF
jgi:RNA polymerase sigma factor (sigma-70 family)